MNQVILNCNICFENFLEEEQVLLTCCEKNMCPKCFKEIIKQNPICPFCRQDIIFDESKEKLIIEIELENNIENNIEIQSNNEQLNPMENICVKMFCIGFLILILFL